jgi:hypothetical protein
MSGPVGEVGTTVRPIDAAAGQSGLLGMTAAASPKAESSRKLRREVCRVISIAAFQKGANFNVLHRDVHAAAWRITFKAGNVDVGVDWQRR